MKELLLIAIGSAIVNNVVLSQFLGICPFLGVSKKTETAAGMGAAVVFVITISSFVTALIYKFILANDYLMSKGWDEPARICLTHSFPIRDVDTDIGRKDITPEQYAFLRDYLAGTEYDDYDRLIILCDSLAMAEGFCILEKRLVDTTRRYGAFPFTVERWNHIFEIKAYFEKKVGRSIYELLPGIEQCIYQ